MENGGKHKYIFDNKKSSDFFSAVFYSPRISWQAYRLRMLKEKVKNRSFEKVEKIINEFGIEI
jgi:hypothetical protein